MKKLLPCVVLSVCLAYVAMAMLRSPRSSGGFDVGGFGRLPVLMNGRVQPIDSVARVGLRQVRGTVTVPLESSERWLFWRRARTLGATEWLLEVLAKPDAADERKIFPIRDQSLLAALQLKARVSSGVNYYTFKELEPKVDEIGKQWRRISKVKAADQAAWERECLRLRNVIVVYERLKNSLQPNSFLQQEAGGKLIAYDFPVLLAQYQGDLRNGLQAAFGQEHGTKKELDKATVERMRAFARPYMTVARVALPAIIPPNDPTGSREHWQNIGATLVESARSGQLPAPVAHFAAMSAAFAQGKPAVFNSELVKYRLWLTTRRLGPEVSRAQYEFFYNAFQPLVRATAIYLLAFLLICAFRYSRSTELYRSAAILVVLACVLHTVGLMFDMMLQGRPPVTNTYSLIIFAGWGAVVLGGGAERFTRNGIGMIGAVVTGLVALTSAYNLAPGGALELIREALDISFWIAAATILSALRISRGRGTTEAKSVSTPGVERAANAPKWRLRSLWRVRPSLTHES